MASDRKEQESAKQDLTVQESAKQERTSQEQASQDKEGQAAQRRASQEPTEPEQAETLNERIAEASRTIFSYCMGKTSNRMEAEDLCQDILCELVRSSGNIRDSKAFYGFMWAVAGNVYKQWCRKRAKLQTCELTEDIPSEESVLDRALSDGEDGDIYLLRRELALLSRKYREAVILYYIDRKSCSEIAQALSVSESRVKYLLFTSRKILKEGMSMERKFGELSYNPKEFSARYWGSGPNRFWEFMQSKIRQNILDACYQDALTEEQISLETGIPLPYMDSEIMALMEKGMLLKEGPRYRANIILLTAECADEIARSCAPCHEKIADAMAEFLETKLAAFRQIGFAGADFTDNTLRWQMMTFLMRRIQRFGGEENGGEKPLTAWGDRAYLWLEEQGNTLGSSMFSFCSAESSQGDWVSFADYLPAPRGSQKDFYGNRYLTNVICDIARGACGDFSKNDLESVAELIQKGYVLSKKDTYVVTMPIFTKAQYEAACRLAYDFVEERMGEALRELDRTFIKVLKEHTPRHLQDQVCGIASTSRSSSVERIPCRLLLDRKVLDTDWNPMEMPTIQIELNE